MFSQHKHSLTRVSCEMAQQLAEFDSAELCPGGMIDVNEYVMFLPLLQLFPTVSYSSLFHFRMLS